MTHAFVGEFAPGIGDRNDINRGAKFDARSCPSNKDKRASALAGLVADFAAQYLLNFGYSLAA